MAEFEDDPVYIDSCREATFLICFWIVCAIWSIGSCYLFGYSEHPKSAGDVATLLPDLSAYDQKGMPPLDPIGFGIPAWAFWGVFVPWVVCILVTLWFAFVWMKDDPDTMKESSGGEGHA